MKHDKEFYCSLALETAAKSNSKKRKVGAVLCNSLGSFKTGFNQSPTGNCEDEDGKTKSDIVHAEVVAITKWKTLARLGAATIIYVTHPPCSNCLEAIQQLELLQANRIEVIVIGEFLKFDKDKLQYDLIPPEVIETLAKVLTHGAKKYKPNNWKSGSADRYLAALYRHLIAYQKGEVLDKDSGFSHLAHVLTNVSFLLYLENKNG